MSCHPCTPPSADEIPRPSIFAPVPDANSEVREFNSISAVCEFRTNPEVIDVFNTSDDMEELEKDRKKALEKGEEDKAEEIRKRLAEMTPLEKGFGKVAISRRCLFSQLPAVLTIQLQRIQYCPLRNSAFKINSRFEFEDQLDLERFCVPSSLDPARLPKYRLFSVIVHSGFSQVGHYVCFLRPEMRSGSNKADWFKFDDETITPCSAEEATEANYGDDVGANRMRSAYLLVYIRESDMDQVLGGGGDMTQVIPEHVKEAMRHSALSCLPQSMSVHLPIGEGILRSPAAAAKELATKDKLAPSPLRGTVVQVRACVRVRGVRACARGATQEQGGPLQWKRKVPSELLPPSRLRAAQL